MRNTIAAIIVSIPLLSFAGERQTFNTGLELLESNSLVNEKSLDFHANIQGQYQVVTVKPDEPGAAIFKAKGRPYGEVRGRIEEHSIQIVNGNGYSYDQWITVSNFTTGGDLSRHGYGRFNSNGKLDNIRIGGTVYINSYNRQGYYEGSATFRLCHL